MIERLLPEGIASACTRTDEGLDALYPEERAYIERAVTKRKVEFAAARVCARVALADLGLPPSPLVPGTRGAVRWPPGVVGSMTHCERYRAAAVGRRERYAAIGIDAEPASKLRWDVLEAIAVRDELVHLEKLSAGRPHYSWGKILFSAKESIYKAWYPYSGFSLAYDDVRVELRADSHEFRAVLLNRSGESPGGFSRLRGRWYCADGYVATSVVLEVGAG